MSFYGIYIPTKTEVEVKDKQCVFTEIDEALKVLKNHKDGRLKVFKSNEDAENYAQTGYEDYQPKFELKSPSATIEKAAFRAPTKQELVLLRKAIEEDKYDAVKKTIWENPRYLVNSGDTPTSLKEGTRYNALHVCAIHNRAKIADLILQTISTVSYIELLHGKKNPKICQEVSDILLDYYLNMPEKGRSETPLHLAAKYGTVEVVEVLTSYPQCKMTQNLEHLLPKDIICSRMNEYSAELKNKISNLLEERFYVPVIRSIDNSIPPVIGEPFSPTNPPEFNKDPMSPELEIQAYAGPMSKEQAQSFRRRWKTPPRVGSPVSQVINSPYIHTPVKMRSSTPTKSVNNNMTPPSIYSKHNFFSNKPLEINLDDNENGNYSNDQISSELENNNGNDIRNSFPILTPLRKNPLKKDLFLTYRDRGVSPVVFDCNDSESSNNSELMDKDVCQTPGWKERHLKLSDTEKGLELIGRELAKEQKVEWKEYWDFLGCFIDISSNEGLTKLESYLAQRQKSEEDENKQFSDKSNDECLINNLCKALDQLCRRRAGKINQLTSHKPNENSTQTVQNTTPYLCVEKSLQVFARRMTKTILHNIESVVSINDALNSELKRLKSLICSFKDDERFFNVDFSVVHSRFAKLIVDYLKNTPDMNADKMIKTKNNFQQIIESKQKSEKGKGRLDEKRDKLGDQKEQLLCVAEFIIKDLDEDEERILPEHLKTEEICAQTWKIEAVCNCTWDSELSRQTNRKKRLEMIEISKKLFDSNGCATKNEENKLADSNNSDTWRKTDYSNDTFSDIEDDEEDIFWSDIESNDEDDIFYTPPESPSVLECDISDDVFKGFNVYLLGNEPTKRDLDVLNALFNVEIDRNTYPNIHRWRAAVLRHPNEERDNFPSPSVVVKGRSESQKSDDKQVVVRRLFMWSPKLVRQSPSNFCAVESRNSDSPMSSPGSSASKTLSFMNVSDV